MCRAFPDRLPLAVDIPDAAAEAIRARRGQVKVEVDMGGAHDGGEGRGAGSRRTRREDGWTRRRRRRWVRWCGGLARGVGEPRLVPQDRGNPVVSEEGMFHVETLPNSTLVLFTPEGSVLFAVLTCCLVGPWACTLAGAAPSTPREQGVVSRKCANEFHCNCNAMQCMRPSQKYHATGRVLINSSALPSALHRALAHGFSPVFSVRRQNVAVELFSAPVVAS